MIGHLTLLCRGPPEICCFFFVFFNTIDKHKAAKNILIENTKTICKAEISLRKLLQQWNCLYLLFILFSFGFSLVHYITRKGPWGLAGPVTFISEPLAFFLFFQQCRLSDHCVTSPVQTLQCHAVNPFNCTAWRIIPDFVVVMTCWSGFDCMDTLWPHGKASTVQISSV